MEVVQLLLNLSLVASVVFPTCLGAPHRRGGHNKKHKANHHLGNRQAKHQKHGENLLIPDFSPQFMSSRMKFSETKPIMPPWPLATPPRDGEVLENEAVAAEGHRNTTNHRRTKRALDHISLPVCESVSEWVELREAEDMWGNRVSVVQEIDIGGTIVNQYFYETYCRSLKSSCMGIDSKRYRSVCENKYIWAYAKIQNNFEQGWNLIKIRGSCNCALFNKNGNGESFLHHLARS